ncbi:BppU family phage baseplate upper protein [Pediococcus pentosaceus]|uniref:BppU family phage baseplate upper protein n=1 Tax=Pediococcus pentosaceus TaxID=1255 RepID=UPI00201722B9|nr:BppU family phage baseplate upper protein [Pediococcus pentosaceus]MCL3857942.1 BppU family phage baseplate upper protein [Pediococcus pentosaceus]
MQKLKYIIGGNKRALVKDVQNFKIDFNTADVHNFVQARQYENTMRQVFVDLVNEGDNTPYDLTGANIMFEGTLPDNTHVIMDAKHGVILDPQNGQFRFDFPKQAFAVAGSYVQAFFRIMRNGDSVTTLEFDLEVLADKVISGLIPADYITPFEDLYDQLETIVINGGKRVDEAIAAWDVKFQAKFNEIAALSQDVANHLIEMRAQLDVIQDKIKSGDIATKTELQNALNQVNNIYGKLNEKADKSYVDNLLSATLTNGPRDVFGSLSDLEKKFPNGELGTYLVDAPSSTDGSHVYIWDATNRKWKDVGSYGANGEVMKQIIADANAYIDHQLRATKMEITDMDNAANDGRWTFSYNYHRGYVKGAWLYIISDADEDYSISLISATTSRILYSVSGKGHGKIVVPVNTYLEDDFMVSLKCNQFAFTTAEENGVKFSNQEFSSTKKGTQINIQWEDDDRPFTPGIEFLYDSLQSRINSIMDVLQTTSYPKTTNEHDFDEINMTGDYWISRNDGDASSVLTNAPKNSSWGSYYLHVAQFNDPQFHGSLRFVSQTAITYGSETGKGIYTRYLLVNGDGSINSDDQNIRRWIRIDRNDNYLEKNKMFVAGDSITAGHPYETQTGIHWWESVQKELGYEVTVGARNGSGFLYQKGNVNGITITDSTDFSKYDVAVLAFGTNDYGNDMELGKVNDLYPSQNTVYGAVNYIINKIYSSNPQITLIFSTPLNRCDKGTLEEKYGYGTKNGKGYTLDDYVQAIINQCDYYGVSYIDNRNSPFNSLSIPSLLTDKLHPTVDGYKVLGGHLAAKIGSIVRPFINN